MPRFRYTATNSDGVPIDGVIEAADQHAAQAALAAQGISVELLANEEAQGLKSETGTPAEPSATSQNSFRLGASDRVEVVGQIGSLMDAGLPLSVGLRTLSEEIDASSRSFLLWYVSRLRIPFARSAAQREVKNARQRSQTLLEMSNRLDAGEALDSVIADATQTLPDWLTQMLSSGMESHTLTQSVHHYVRFTRLRNSLRGTVFAAMAYPAILIFVSLLIFCGLFGWMIPQFTQIFEGFGMDLPAVTQLLVSTSKFCVLTIQHLPAVLLTLLVVLLVSYAGLRAVVGPGTTRRFLYEVPLIGRVVKLTALCEFCHLLALLIENRVPLPRALSLVGSSMTDPCLAQCAHDASRYVEQGESLAAIRARVPNLPVELLRIPGFDRPDESLPEALRTSSDIFAAQCEVSTRAMAGAATPIVIVVVGGLTVVTVTGLFMPLVKLLSYLS